MRPIVYFRCLFQFILVILIFSCQKAPKEVERILDLAGDNRTELQVGYELNKSILVGQDRIWTVVAFASKISGQESAKIFCKISRFHRKPDYWI